MNFTTTWRDKPIYDDWGWGDHWGCKEWMDWYTSLKLHFGYLQARDIWNAAYASADATDTLKSPFGCGGDIVFLAWIKNNGLLYGQDPRNSTVYDKIYNSSLQLAHGVKDINLEAIDVIKKAEKGAGKAVDSTADLFASLSKSIGNMVPYAIGAAILLVIIIVIVVLYKTDTNKVVAAAAPMV